MFYFYKIIAIHFHTESIVPIIVYKSCISLKMISEFSENSFMITFTSMKIEWIQFILIFFSVNKKCTYLCAWFIYHRVLPLKLMRLNWNMVIDVKISIFWPFYVAILIDASGILMWRPRIINNA